MKHNGGPHRADNGTNRRPEDILAEIEQTRHEMDSTLTAIEHRLTPGQLVDQGLDYLRNSGANEFVQNLGGQVKYNPLPVALVGLGVAWLMASSKNPPPRHGSDSYTSSLSGGTGEMRDKASGMMSSAKSRVSDGTQAVGDRVRQARDSLSSASQSARQRIGDLSDSARHQMDRARGGIDYMMREQPLALGAVGLAIGAVLAAMAPRTRKEDELMGETRDQLMEKAKQAGQETLQQTTEAARKGVEQVKEATVPKEKEKEKTTVGVHRAYGDAPTQSVPPALGAAPSAGAAPAVGADLTPRGPGGPRNKP
jgi:ElaB/YqjD/DUF883 family membrane-anchored ribosome-binding protein